MATLFDVPLSEEDEIIITDIVIDMANGAKISEADILHELIKRAESYTKLEITTRELRKLKQRCENKKRC